MSDSNDTPELQEASRLSKKEILELCPAAFVRQIKGIDKQKKQIAIVPFEHLQYYRRCLKAYLHENKDVEKDAKELKKYTNISKNFNRLDCQRRTVVKSGVVESTRRVAGTGVRKEIEKPYIDSPYNRARGLVGKTYKRVVYEGAEMETYKPKIKVNKRRRGVTNKNSVWIESFGAAKEEFGIPNDKWFAALKTVKDPNNETEVLRNKVYLRGMEIKEERMKNKANEAKESCDEPTAIESE